ncbi:MAG: hypothetical protein EOO15_02770 [Chitinophagaceae bacterium]|nr:MAG: hypothetical protein EOO15_02770 [Chitinophagaceae bacterium]
MSEKNHVFERLFQQRFDPATKTVVQALVTQTDVVDAIKALKAEGVLDLSERNPANFMKDYLRSPNRNTLWPKAIRDAGFTAKQRTGGTQCFEFVALPVGEDPFPDDYVPGDGIEEHVAQTLSLPVATREIVRLDEQSLAQIAVKLHLVEHFLASSPKTVGWGVHEVVHLQNNVKLHRAEIDMLYQAVRRTGDRLEVGVVTVEVKIGDPIIAEQIEKQVVSALDDKAFAFCIPMIFKRFRRGEIVAMHLDMIERDDVQADGTTALSGIAHAARYTFKPALPKI